MGRSKQENIKVKGRDGGRKEGEINVDEWMNGHRWMNG